MDVDDHPNGRKRAHSEADDVAPNPSSIKRRRLDESSTESPSSTPNALSAIASAISGVFGYGQKTQEPTDGGTGAPPPDHPSDIQQPPPSQSQPQPKPAAPPIFRPPAIKGFALKGTIWDTGEERRPVLPKKTATARQPKPPKAPVPKKPAAPRGRPRKKKVQDADEHGAPTSKARTGELGSNDELATDHAQLPPSARKLAPKGIMTPTKKRGPRSRKSVTFGSGKDANGEVFFEDLPKKPLGRKPALPAADEIVCEICSRPDSKAPNEIILCDNCDFAVHQECYEVLEIPEGDWLCKSCAQEDVLKTPKKTEEADEPTVAATVAATAPSEVPDIPNLDQHVRALQRVLVDRCTGQRQIKMFGQQDAHEKIYQLVEQTVVAGEGNSMLVIGARGSGKTVLLENIVSDLSRLHRHDFHVVRLNGFIHTDDKLALKEIWRQLGKEMQVEDDLVNRTNYADTMASLLALLSHPSEILGTDEGVTSQSIVFIIDEFDMFASHPRQTLLYNLFDVAQSRKAPIAVLGCTTRLDVVEMLEKRVKSRFSHRYVYLSLPKSLPLYWQMCRQGLIVDSEDAVKEGIDMSLEGHDEFQKFWNHKIEALYKERSFQDLLQYHYYTTKSVSAFLTEWIISLSSLSGKDVTLKTPSVQEDADSLTPPDSRLHLLSTLSDLDLGLLIAAARLDIVAHTDTVNLAMAYDEYSSLMGKQRVQSATSGMLAVGGGVRVWSRGVAGIAWERLISLGLLVPAGIGGARSLGHGGLEGKMWKVDVALEEIPAAVKLSTVLARWCREI
ncbi:origin recognition complex subunit 4 C-terminus-domain-containing protein [Dactylonectria macrodidyma]|uniref:Origin recognition complex subunit 4 n=1 Tax=Dactylonectria macrodidyma TaxID=307937 RepID=A0A9P9FDN1_9HYPO|nr:origin recognition complex subunit 4 C-terminus-domain-containing protein [Dactylonectria macrodidyma]